MGAPFTCVWNQFTLLEIHESLNWLEVNIDFIEEQIKMGRVTEEAQIAVDLIKQGIPKKGFWFKHMWDINLPDAKDGHAILIVENGRFSLKTYSRGLTILQN